MMKSNFRTLKDICRELVDCGLVSPDQLAVALEMQRNRGGNLGNILIKKGFVTEEQVLEFFSERLKIPFLSLKDHKIDPQLTKQIPRSMANKYRFIPIVRTDDVITVAMASPLDMFVLDELSLELKCSVNPVLASWSEIEALIKEGYRTVDFAEEMRGEVEVVQYSAEISEDRADRLKEMASGASVVAEVNRLITGAVREKASDVHIEPQAGSLRIRNRVDGVLEERVILSKQMHLPIVTRIKIMAGMDIAERRVPQDGRVRLKALGRVIDLRISSYPTMHGEKVVIRLLTKEQLIGLESLGFSERDLNLFEEIISRPHGIFLVSGPTGSGKTTTLYAALQRINSQDRNIISIEDPIENEISGVNQAQVNVKAGMTFASALRSILRQDPDVIMVGEIRDRETADIAVRAAITGHLVFSTIHTNTALGAVTRLEDLGVEPFMIASGLIGVMSQRLVRRICDKCRVSYKADLTPLGLKPGSNVFRGQGCKRCRMTGYAGRIGLFELAVVGAVLRDMIMKRVSEDALIAEARKQGVLELRAEGVKRILEGVTTVEEVLRVTEER